jgi:hypothetical protein
MLTGHAKRSFVSRTRQDDLVLFRSGPVRLPQLDAVSIVARHEEKRVADMSEQMWTRPASGIGVLHG